MKHKQRVWNTSDDPVELMGMVRFVNDHHGDNGMPYVTQRQLRLFAVSCCRSVWPKLIKEKSRHAVEVAERYADGKATLMELGDASELARRLTEGIRWVDCKPEYMAWWASGRQIEEAFFDNHVLQLNSGMDDANRLRHIVGNLWSPCPGRICHECYGSGWDMEECDVCGNGPDESGSLEHGKGCYVLDSDGGGSEAADECGTCRGQGWINAKAPEHWPTDVLSLAEAMYEGASCGFALHDALMEIGQHEIAEHFITCDCVKPYNGTWAGLLGCDYVGLYAGGIQVRKRCPICKETGKANIPHPKGCWVVDYITKRMP